MEWKRNCWGTSAYYISNRLPFCLLWDWDFYRKFYDTLGGRVAGFLEKLIVHSLWFAMIDSSIIGDFFGFGLMDWFMVFSILQHSVKLLIKTVVYYFLIELGLNAKRTCHGPCCYDFSFYSAATDRSSLSIYKVLFSFKWTSFLLLLQTLVSAGPPCLWKQVFCMRWIEASTQTVSDYFWDRYDLKQQET